MPPRVEVAIQRFHFQVCTYVINSFVQHDHANS